ncbi:hypothetical protein DXG01_003107 [Tephrocybe rancida]|nr:hypothetical protein DXG01_003107 [Tephrocybe rancida]
MDYLTASGPDLSDLSYHAGTTAPTITQPSRRINHRRHLLTTHNASIPLLAESPRKFAIGGFLPLPSISASPICTPTSSQDSVSDESLIKSIEEFTTAPSSPAISSGGSSTPPTWISTPPTPPPRMVRRSVTCFPRPISRASPSASFPATSLPHQNDYFMKRRNSVPSMPPLITSRSLQEYNHNTSVDDITLVASSSDASERLFGPSLSRSKPIFHIPNDTDTEDSPRLTDSPERIHEDLSLEGSWSDHESEDNKPSEKSKDNIRKFHALKELLDTEVGYLLDLRALVTVYLRIMPTLVSRPPPPTTFGRASSSFSSSPWVNSYTYAAVTSASSSAISDSYAVSSLNSLQSKDPQKVLPRYLFTDTEVEVLTRNAEEILQLHEQFVRELRKEMVPLGFNMEAYQRDPDKTSNLAMQNTDTAIRILSTKFAAEASRFASYQVFCAGHPEALDLVRKVVAQRPAEWDAFEQRCAALVNELELCTTAECESATTSDDHDTPSPVLVRDRSRAVSISSLEGAVRTLRSCANNMQGRDAPIAPMEVTPVRKEKSTPRLAFIDYMIKPVQRICKYPLMLDQLRSSKSVRALSEYSSDVDVVVESAKQAMKHVASAVDEARHRQDVSMRSALIASRITFGTPAMSSLYPTFKPLSPSFLSSLGTCLLAGSLDVIHHSAKPSGSNVIVKYLGAFLYLGGYIIFVKVVKGKAYEPKHWFSLADFDICDVDDSDATLPSSFRISSKDHRFDLAAACQREKDAWLRSIGESRSHNPSWINEPTPSIRFDGKGDLIPSALDDGPFELVNILPTIQSIPELAGNTEYSGLTETLLMAFGSDTKHRRPARQDVMAKQDFDPLSRRSSTASVKGIFAPLSSDSETIVIRRYSSSARSRVDQGLHDVISQLCLTARSYASIKDEELFPAPRATRGVFVRSQSGLSISGMAAKSRLTRHESVRVLRRKSMIDKPDSSPSKKSSMSSGQSSTSRRQSAAVSVTAMSDSEPQRPHIPHSPLLSSPSTPPLTSSTQACSSPKSSVRGSIFFSSTIKPPRETTAEHRSPMKTSRSLVSGVKELLFQSRSSSSALSLGHSESTDIDIHGSKARKIGSIKRWAKDSIHRRTRSAPDEEPFILPDIRKLPALNMDLPGLEYETTIPLTGSPKSYATPPTPERLPAEKTPLRSSFMTSPVRCQSPTEFDHHGPGHISLLRRLKA